ncbi:MAG: SUMF1/EgtB/PvdO family nonheme iron enzyme [Bacteroidota bacterium]
MDHWERSHLTVLLFPLACVCLLFGCVNDSHEEEQVRRSATPVAVSFPVGVSVSVFSAGQDLEDVHPVSNVADGPLWLTPGRWIIEAHADGRTRHYPATLTGYRSGPDDGGAFIISIRRQWEGEAPMVPGMIFVTVPSGWFLLGDRRSPPSSRCSATLVPTHPDHERFGRDDLPVTHVTWYEAQAYCRWLTTTYGGGRWLFELPSEAEWEKAARGPDDLDYGLSQSVSDRESSWYNWKKNPGAEETVVGLAATRTRYRSNRYGLYHMSGNVTEWTQSISVPFSRHRPYRNDERNHDDTPGQRVARGGSWYSASVALLSTSYRESFPPEHSTQELGFRVVARHLP